MNDLVANVLLSDSADRAQWMKTSPGEQCLIRVSADDNTASIPWLRSYPALATVRHCTFMKEPLPVHERKDEYMFVVDGADSRRRRDHLRAVAERFQIKTARPGTVLITTTSNFVDAG
jgi:mannose-6-phosphate isomerase-like protein (cupin superfamily)